MNDDLVGSSWLRAVSILAIMVFSGAIAFGVIYLLVRLSIKMLAT